jgi:hypothetical protein
MIRTTDRLDDLRQRLVALRSRFGDVGARAAAAAMEISSSVAPSAALLDDLRATSVDFDELRQAIVNELSAFPNTPDPTKLGTLKALDAVLAAMERVQAEHVRRDAWETARDNALAVLDRVLTLIHREDKDFSALAECQAQARELHEALASAPSGDAEQLGAHLRPFVELVTLADGWDHLDDERCASLQDAITQSFGRPLGLAALRGKLGQPGEALAEPDAPAPLEPEPPVDVVPEAPVVPPPAKVVAPPLVVPAPPPVVPAPPPRPRIDDERVAAPPGSPLLVELRMSGERVQVETPQERSVREALLERLAAEHARWWVGAREGWEELVRRGTAPAEAARDALGRFPYLFAVPLSHSDQFESGRLAQGYAILLQRLEKEEPGFVKGALARLNPQLAGRVMDDSYPLGQELYQYVVAEGRLYKTFPELLRDALGHTLPEPGLWLQGSITETNDATTIVTRPERPGDRHEDSRTLTQAAERFTAHRFSVTTGALTARVFSVQAGELAEPTDLEIQLRENGAATDRAWIVSAPMTGKPEAPRKHRAGGTKLEQLGRQLRAVWVAAFNSDPNAEKTYELTISLSRKSTAAAKPDVKAAPSASPFKRR